MSLSTFIVFLAVLFVGVPASLRVSGARLHVRNPTALALVGTWFFGQAVCAAAGGHIAPDDLVKLLILQDLVVIAAIYAKIDWSDCSPYRSIAHQLACLWYERSPCDRAILALFPLAWLFYAPIASPQLQYWTLYAIGLAQLALAGWEAFRPWLELMAKKLRAVTAERPPPGSEFHAAWRLAGYE